MMTNNIKMMNDMELEQVSTFSAAIDQYFRGVEGAAPYK